MSYRITPIAQFDARRGYRRCPLPGVGVSLSGRPIATADFWRNRSGNVAMRFSSQGYTFSFEAAHSIGKSLSDSELDAFGEHVANLLSLWLAEGVDDDPSV